MKREEVIEELGKIINKGYMECECSWVIADYVLCYLKEIGMRPPSREFVTRVDGQDIKVDVNVWDEESIFNPLLEYIGEDNEEE